MVALYLKEKMSWCCENWRAHPERHCEMNGRLWGLDGWREMINHQRETDRKGNGKPSEGDRQKELKEEEQEEKEEEGEGGGVKKEEGENDLCSFR